MHLKGYFWEFGIILHFLYLLGQCCTGFLIIAALLKP